MKGINQQLYDISCVFYYSALESSASLCHIKQTIRLSYHWMKYVNIPV